MKNSIAQFKQHLIKQFSLSCAKAFGEEPRENIKIDFPPNASFGDFTIACFPFAEQFKKNPNEIASEISNIMNPDKVVSSVNFEGPYVNITLWPDLAFSSVIGEIKKQGNEFGNSKIVNGEKVMVEYMSPNTNKPLHLGHVRNGVLGMAVSNLLEATGHKVIKANLINDRGVHICKSMLAYKKWAQGKTPKSENKKGDHFVGDLYVMYSSKVKESPEIEQEVQDMLKRWENGDSEIVNLWKKMNDWVYQGFEQTYTNYGFEFDVIYHESETYKLGRDIVNRGVKKGIFKKTSDGLVIAPLPEDKFNSGKVGDPMFSTLLRGDGTSLYMTQDIGTAVLRFKEHKLTKLIYVTGSEQKHHFKALFEILSMLGFKWARECFHLPYGMVYLPEGKMKSREGKIIDADDLFDQVSVLAQKEIFSRDSSNSESVGDVVERSKKIAQAAIKFYLARVSPNQDVHFDPKESISFDGETGPYCQYTYARCQSILRKAKEEDLSSDAADFSKLGNSDERNVLRALFRFPDVILRASSQMNPSLLCSWSCDCAKSINKFYQNCKVVDAGSDKGLVGARLALVEASSVALQKGINLLGIKTIDKM